MPSMTPIRALTIALARVIESDIDAGRAYAMQNRVDAAGLALSLATRALPELPDGWALIDDAAVRAEVAQLEASIAATEATTRLLLAFQIERDGHARNLGEAARIARDRDRVRELYPELG